MHSEYNTRLNKIHNISSTAGCEAGRKSLISVIQVQACRYEGVNALWAAFEERGLRAS